MPGTSVDADPLDMKASNGSTKPGTISVLYVDDDAANQMAMRAILAQEANLTYTLTEALDDEDAVECIDSAEHYPDVILMDQGLGHVTGEEVMHALVKAYGNVFTFVICTGLSHAEAASLASRAGAAGFLCKPYQADAVLGMLRTLTAQARGSAAAAGAAGEAGA